ncbi:MAG: FKBP-type peptidyl-prolyl cis-trans isomerase [Alphaproteobacteria bacterium]|nr:FKBP-type peptidyl-prolyl cis-trans isomerase [Alphaproteobacteria bacterium]
MKMPASFFLALVALTAPALADAPTPDAIAAYLAANAQKPGVTVAADGLQYDVRRRGVGRHPAPNDFARIQYTARLIDGTLVDGTTPGLPATVSVGAAIAGLGEALRMMQEGDRWQLVVPARLAFGQKGAGAVPPNQPLVIDVTLIAAVPAARAQAEAGANPFSIQGNGQQQSLLFTFRP